MTQTPAAPSSFRTLVTISVLATLGGASLGFLLRSQPDVLPKAGLLQREQSFPDRSWPGESMTDLDTSSDQLWFDSPRSMEEGYGVAPEEYGTESYGYEEVYPEGYPGAEGGVESEFLGEEGDGLGGDREFQDGTEGYGEPAADSWQDPNAAPLPEGGAEVAPDLEVAPSPEQDLPALTEPAPAPPEAAPIDSSSGGGSSSGPSSTAPQATEPAAPRALSQVPGGGDGAGQSTN
ncbi:MAG: hypothetical protein ACO331_04370 [Prochlorothrix sp.]